MKVGRVGGAVRERSHVNTCCVWTTEQTIQARRLRCWPGVTKLEDIVDVVERTKVENARSLKFDFTVEAVRLKAKACTAGSLT